MGTGLRRRMIMAALATTGAACGASLADTPVGGLILEDTVWSAQGSPYIVTSSIVVGGDATLTVEPGVSVRFGAGLSMLVGSTAFGGATFIARGTAESPIVFTSDAPAPAPGDWGQMVLGEGLVDAVYDGDTGGYVSGSAVEHCRFEFGGGSQADEMLAVFGCAPRLAHLAVLDSLRRGMYVNVRSGRTLRLESCEFLRNGDGTQTGGGLAFGSPHDAPHVLLRCRFEQNYGNWGGALSVAPETVSVVECAFVENTAAGPFGGAVYCADRFIDFAGCAFTGNSCTREGGAIWSGDGENRIIDCSFESNRAEGGIVDGGAVYIDGGINTIARCVFIGNAAVSSNSNAVGGAVRMDTTRGVSRVEDCRFEGNSAVSQRGYALGGALWADVTDVVGCSFSGNEAVGVEPSAHAYGGALLLHGSPSSVRFSVFEANSVEGVDAAGGAVWQESLGGQYVGNEFRGNASSVRGGAISISSRCSLRGDPATREFNTFVENEAPSGADIYNGVAFDPDGDNDIDASYVCWGTSDLDEIAGRVYDFFDDATRSVVGFLPPAPCAGDCPADWNGDGLVNTLDFVAYLNDWSARDPRADLDGNGVVNTADFIIYLNLWAAGC